MTALKAMKMEPSPKVADYLAQPSFDSKELGTIVEGDSEGSTMDVSTDGWSLSSDAVYQLIAKDTLMEEAREQQVRSAVRKSASSSSWRDPANERTIEGYVDVEAICTEASKEEQKLIKRAKQKEGRTKEGTGKKSSTSAEAAKKLRDKNDEFIKLKGKTKKGKTPPVGSCFHITPPTGQSF